VEKSRGESASSLSKGLCYVFTVTSVLLFALVGECCDVTTAFPGVTAVLPGVTAVLPGVTTALPGMVGDVVEVTIFGVESFDEFRSDPESREGRGVVNHVNMAYTQYPDSQHADSRYTCL
jgi:hypothetical protein